MHSKSTDESGTPDARALTAREVAAGDHETVVPLLLLAEPSMPSLRWSLRNLSDTVYRFDLDGQLVGAASVRWRGNPSEIVELAVAPAHQSRGIGRRIIDWLLAEAKRRGRGALEVGTSSASLDNIAFYQKCGFRPTAVRPDYFRYHAEPIVENGIVVRDMIVFTRQIDGPAVAPRRRSGR